MAIDVIHYWHLTHISRHKGSAKQSKHKKPQSNAGPAVVVPTTGVVAPPVVAGVAPPVVEAIVVGPVDEGAAVVGSIVVETAFVRPAVI